MTDEQKPTVIICSDASYSYTSQVSTWAAYIKTPDKVIKTGGVLKQAVNNSTVAEMLGLANALFTLNKLIDLSQFNLVVYCDNKQAMEKPRIRVTPASKYYDEKAQQLKWFEDHIEPLCLKAASFEMKHVKAHLNSKRYKNLSPDDPKLMNRWCDTEAKRLLRTERTKLKKENQDGN